MVVMLCEAISGRWCIYVCGCQISGRWCIYVCGCQMWNQEGGVYMHVVARSYDTSYLMSHGYTQGYI